MWLLNYKNNQETSVSEYMKENLETLTGAPFGMQAYISIPLDCSDPDLEPGAIFCLKDMAGKVNVDPSYALAPYYLLYISEDGTVKQNVAQSKRVLDILKNQCTQNQKLNPQTLEKFSETTNAGRNMSRYRELLETAVNSITQKSDEKGMESLFKRGGTTFSKDTFQGINDFEVVGWLVILPGHER